VCSPGPLFNPHKWHGALPADGTQLRFAVTILARVHFDRPKTPQEAALAATIEDEEYHFGRRRRLPSWLVGNIEAYAAGLCLRTPYLCEIGLTLMAGPGAGSPGGAGTPAGVPDSGGIYFRWCRYAQPPATGFHPFGMDVTSRLQPRVTLHDLHEPN
jgi:hypothetical protein